ncbi:MAG: TylF/MycF/NovP-related O-methyltransferase [Lachnospiraceae bacterium]|nr:TylF/MycF/NovP-related O-methyltransferase [Lachnospiraceae bacterium]
MKTVVILETEHLSIPVSDLLNPKEMKLVGIGNSNSDTWNVFANEETGELKENMEGIPVMPIDLAVSLQPDVIVIAATDAEKSHALQYMAIRAGFLNDILFINDLYTQFTVKGSVIRRLTRRLGTLGVAGNVAELGCYQGDLAWQFNILMPDRKLYLFDTFEGFDERDIAKEQELNCSPAKIGQFSQAKEERLMERMPVPEQVIVKKGWFPESAFDMEDEKFALVHIDACLYQPTYCGIQFFFPRMSQGGVILLSGYEDTSYTGVRRAVQDLEEKYGAFLLLPLGDLKGTVMIVHP